MSKYTQNFKWHVIGHPLSNFNGGNIKASYKLIMGE